MENLVVKPPTDTEDALEHQLAVMTSSALPLPLFRHTDREQASIAYEGNYSLFVVKTELFNLEQYRLNFPDDPASHSKVIEFEGCSWSGKRLVKTVISKFPRKITVDGEEHYDLPYHRSWPRLNLQPSSCLYRVCN